MRLWPSVRNWLAAVALLAAGCQNNPYVLQGQVQDLRRDQQGLATKADDLQRRSHLLDSDNQNLGAMLAQSRQQSKLLEDQTAALRDQLKSATIQIARLRDEKQELESRGSLAAGPGQRPRAAILANNSLRENLPRFNYPGVEVRIDGDVVRIELPGNQLFESGSAKLRPGAPRLIEEVAAEIQRRYPEQIIGLEGHTDSDAIAHSNQWVNNHQLSIARATSVYDHITQRTRIKPQQLFIVGHGPNHPVVSNATPAGKERNRRVELVIYPEQMNRS